MNVIATVEIKDQCITDMLTNALEGGSTYWARKVKDEDFAGMEFASEAPMAGGKFTLVHDDPEGDGLLDTTITRERCKQGLQTMANDYPRHFANLIAQDDDAETADVFLQCVVFDEVIFG